MRVIVHEQVATTRADNGVAAVQLLTLGYDLLAMALPGHASFCTPLLCVPGTAIAAARQQPGQG
jgi:hypothetical protein